MNRDKVTVAQIEVCETAKKMYHSGLVAGTWGNISARVDDEYMVCLLYTSPSPRD